MREFTPTAIVLGILIGVVMGAANAYLGLRYGLTISASIPAAVISMGILRGILRRGTLLENNMVQTVGSAGESLAAGVIFTVPALFILAADYPEANLAPQGWPGYLKIVTFGVLGGVLGVLMMIPLRRYLIVQQHSELPYPEGTACAEVLKSGQKGATGAALVFGGLGIGALHKAVGSLSGLWQEKIVIPVRNASLSLDLRTNVSMEAVASLLGVGFILGLRISAIMVGGGLLAWLGIIPLIAYFGQFIEQPLAPATVPIRELDPDGIWTSYIRYVGAGGVVFGGLASLFKSFPTITGSLWYALVQLFRGRERDEERTDRDLPIWLVAGGTLVIIALVWLVNQEAGLPGAIAVAVAGFIFVAVASRIVGYVGSTSSPVSGMTIATLLGTGLIFAGLGFSGAEAMAALIGVGAVVCIALAIAGDCSQDLKTGYLVGATPSRQQVGEIIGVVTSALTCAVVLLLLNETFGFLPDDAVLAAAEGRPVRQHLQAPQANVVALVLKGILDTGLPWELVLVGMACAFVVECLGVSSLPFAVGLYLPLELTTPIFVGGLLHWFVAGRKSDERGTRAGVLGASGLVAGDALMGLGLAGLMYAEVNTTSWLGSLAERPAFGFLARLIAWRDADDAPWQAWVVTLVPFALLMLWLSFITWRHRSRPGDDDRESAPAPAPSPQEPQPTFPPPQGLEPVAPAMEPLPVTEPLPAIPFDDTTPTPTPPPTSPPSAPVEEEPTTAPPDATTEDDLDRWLKDQARGDSNDWFGTERDDDEDDPFLRKSRQ